MRGLGWSCWALKKGKKKGRSQLMPAATVGRIGADPRFPLASILQLVFCCTKTDRWGGSSGGACRIQSIQQERGDGVGGGRWIV